MLSVVMLNVMVLSVVAPFRHPAIVTFQKADMAVIDLSITSQRQQVSNFFSLH
jgi:hypothetical protein